MRIEKIYLALALAIGIAIAGGITKPQGRVPAGDDLYSGSSLTHRVTRPPTGGGELTDDPAIGDVIARLESESGEQIVIRRKYVAPKIAVSNLTERL